MATHYLATFNDTVLTRTSRSGRAYTHAWGVTRQNGETEPMGFSGSEQLARQAADARCSQIRRWAGEEAVPVIVPAVPVTAAALKAAAATRREPVN